MQENYKLLFLYVAILLVILLRVALEPDGFTTPDSIHYIGAAQALVTTGDLEYTFRGETSVFTIWPVGYPMSIAAVCSLTGISEFWGSKIVNLLWIGFSLALFHKLFPKHAFWIGLVFCMHSLLDIFSFSWSEGGFMVIMLWFSVALHHFLFKPNQQVEWAFQLLFAIITAFLYRYFGGFLLGVLSLFGVYFLLKRKWKEVNLLLGIAAGVMGFIFFYFWFVKQHTGYYSGTTRIPSHEPFLLLFKNLSITVFNEVLLIRKITFKQTDYLSLAFLLVQVSVFAFVFRRIHKISNWKTLLTPSAADSLPLTIAFVGMCYWMTMVILRFFMRFDMFDFRLLSPATLLFLVAIHGYLATGKREVLLSKIKGPVAFLYLIALAHGLYKKNLLTWLSTHLS